MKKIALIVDKVAWAYYNNACSIKKYLSKYYDIDIIPSSYLDDNLLRILLLVQDYDLVHFFWRYQLNLNNPAFLWDLEMSGITKEDFIYRYLNQNKISTAVYDHLFLDEDFDITQTIFKYIKYYSVSSNILKNIYDNLDIKYKPTTVLTDGVNLDLFYPKNLERFENISKRTIKIGWVGNSKWAGNEDCKGLKTLLIPVIEKLKKDGFNVEGSFADSQESFIPHDKMVDYYANIDILVCVSKIEGTPNPVLEALACGVPIVSTDVGIVREALGKKQSKYIIKERNLDPVYDTLKQLLEHCEEMKDLSKENIKNSKKWSWQKVALNFKTYFDMILESNQNEQK